MRSLDKNEAEALLNDPFAQDELEKHLIAKFGPVSDLFHINYRVKDIMNRYIKHGKSVGNDEIMDFEQVLISRGGNESGSLQHDEAKQMIEEASFEDLLALAKDELNIELEYGEKSKKKKKDTLMKPNTSQAETVVEDLRKKERKLLGLDKQISRSGFLVFEDRISKLKMMNTPLFLFGMKLFRQNGHLEFFDADFCNTILVKSEDLVDTTLRDTCSILNEMLTKAGFEGNLLKVGKLKDLAGDFDLGKILVRKDFQISLRFNTFTEALQAFKCLS